MFGQLNPPRLAVAVVKAVIGGGSCSDCVHISSALKQDSVVFYYNDGVVGL